MHYIDLYPLAAISLKSWHNEFSQANFTSFNELKGVYGNASVIANKRVVFNIKGNSYRLITSFNFDAQAVYVIWFGTHSAYDKIDAANVKFFKNPNKRE
ncbi:type II toxin-antitoxin system HigB family toxin [uncultured Mucilaginibacter sp.]|nr:type II toxin-antitoxin system HigB family toxin [uncultured Mucilaginibacter sp.]